MPTQPPTEPNAPVKDPNPTGPPERDPAPRRPPEIEPPATHTPEIEPPRHPDISPPGIREPPMPTQPGRPEIIASTPDTVH